MATRLGLRRRGKARHKVVAYDYGIKRNILRNSPAVAATDRGCRAQTRQGRAAMQRNGVFLSNGRAIPSLRLRPCGDCRVSSRPESPLLAFAWAPADGLASGAKTMKMNSATTGANHPVKDWKPGRLVITSQNHGFAVESATLTPN